MKAAILQKQMADAFGIASRAAAPKALLEILSQVYVGTDEDALVLAGTNLETAIRVRVPAKIEEPGAVALPIKTFGELVKQSPDGRLDLTANGKGTLECHCATIKSTVRGLGAGDFPAIPEFGYSYKRDPGRIVTLSAEILKTAIEHTAFSAASDDARPILAGILFHLEDDKLTLATADGFRLSVWTSALSQPTGDTRKVIVPARGMAEVARLLPGEGEVQVAFVESQIQFQLGAVEVFVQLIEGNFPDYKQIVPKQTVTRTVVDTGLLHKAVKRAAIFARESANIVRLAVAPGDLDQMSTLTVAAEAADTGNSSEVLPALVEGEAIEIAFSARYLNDLLGVLDAPQVAMETTSYSAPGKFTGVNLDNYVHVIMPMHISNR